MFTPNRMEENWPRIKPLLQKEWDLLSDDDLEEVGGHFDKLVEIIRQRYGGRVEIMQEAAIRDTVNEILAKVESGNAEPTVEI